MKTAGPATAPPLADGSVTIRLLGDLEVRRAGQVVALPASKRTRALLGFLVVADAPQMRQTLCDLLWDGPDDPRGALRWSLSKLRDVIDEAQLARISADRERVAFVRRDVVIDVDRVRALVNNAPDQAALPALEEAANLLQGEFLDGLDLPACHRFHHWCMAERERFGILRRKILGGLVDRLRHDPSRALPYARGLIVADPLSEGAHAGLIRLLVSLGRQQDAETHCQRASELLRHEVGTAAAETLLAALREARRARPAPRPPEVSSTAIASGNSCPRNQRDHASPLIGRDAEHARIISVMASLGQGDAPRPILFVGEAGIGKTRLLETLATAAEGRGARVAFARCFEAEMVRPFGCFIDALRGLPESCIPDGLRADLSPMLPATPRAAPDGGDRERLLAGIAGCVRTLTMTGPFVLILDDLQWMDEASASLMHFLARSAIPGFLLAGAARAGEVDDNPWTKRLLQSLARDDLLEQSSIASLTHEETAKLVGLDPGDDDAATAYRTSGGNPLLALELALARSHGTEIRHHSLDTLIADRLARLTDEEKDIVVWAAAIGREFRPELLGACVGLEEGVLFARLERLGRHGLLRPTSDGHFDFAHDLVRQGVYRRQSQPHRRMLHRQIARTLVAVVADDPSLYGDLVHHAELAEEHSTAVRACLAAGERCLRLFANAQADATADRGLAHLRHLADGRERIGQHIRLLGMKVFAGITTEQRDPQPLLDALDHASDAALLAGMYAEATNAQHIISWLHQRANDTERTRQATMRAERISRTADTATRCQQLANTGRCLLDVESSVPRALALIAEAEAMAEEHNLHFVELEWGRALAARWRGELDIADSLMARALSFAGLREDRWREAECLVWRAVISLERDDLHAVEARCDEIERVMDRMEQSHAPLVAALRALVGLRRSAPDADASLDAGLRELRALDDKGHVAYSLATAAVSYLEKGDEGRARAAGEESLALASVLQRPTEIVVAEAILARVAAAEGDSARAAARIASARAHAGDSPSARGRAHIRQAEHVIRAHFPTVGQMVLAHAEAKD